MGKTVPFSFMVVLFLSTLSLCTPTPKTQINVLLRIYNKRTENQSKPGLKFSPQMIKPPLTCVYSRKGATNYIIYRFYEDKPLITQRSGIVCKAGPGLLPWLETTGKGLILFPCLLPSSLGELWGKGKTLLSLQISLHYVQVAWRVNRRKD